MGERSHAVAAKAGQEADPLLSGRHWLHASNLYSIAAYPHIKGDELAEQAQALANRAYEEAAQRLPGCCASWSSPSSRLADNRLFAYAERRGAVSDGADVRGLDSLQTDYYNLYENYFSPLGIAMLTIDMPSIGFSSKWTLNQDTSLLHQHALRHLENVPWIDHTRVAAFGFRFGANIAVRLGYLEPQRLKAVACLGPVVHGLLVDPCIRGACRRCILTCWLRGWACMTPPMKRYAWAQPLFVKNPRGLLGRRCPTPMLSGFWKDDPFSPEEESRLITSSSADGKLLEIPFNPVYRNFDHALRQIARWINHRFG